MKYVAEINIDSCYAHLAIGPENQVKAQGERLKKVMNLTDIGGSGDNMMAQGTPNGNWEKIDSINCQITF